MRATLNYRALHQLQFQLQVRIIMNRAYKLVWNTAQQAWVVTSELGKSRKKTKATVLVLAVAMLGGMAQQAMADPASRALPVLSGFASGTATTATATGSLTVNQTSDKLIANWSSFDVGVLSKVTFNQPAITSVALNRISSAAPSEIFGKVLANGRLILVNPTGLTFGPSSQVNASSVIASTLNITDANFLADNLQFDRGPATGGINNQGTLLATEGNTFVFAPSINSSGTIRAKGGNVTVANGNRLTVDQVAGTATLNQVSGVAGVIQSTGILRGDRLTTTDKGKVFIVGDRARNGSAVNLAGEITSTGIDVKAKTLNITGDLAVNSNTSLNATNSINIDGALNVDGNNRLISLAYGTSGSDNLYFGENGKINLPGNTIRYRDNGVFYPIIKTLAELQAIGTNSTTLAGQYVLAADIDATGVIFNPLGSSATSTPFTGYLDGLGHKISNLTINKPAVDEVGLISYALFATVKHLNLSNAAITGQNYVGGLIGRNGVDNGMTGHSVVFNNRISGTVTGKAYVGGLIGVDRVYNSGSSTVNANTDAALVTGRYYIGGLTGWSSINNGSLTLNNNRIFGNTQASAVNEDKSDIGGLIGRLEDYTGSTATMQNNIIHGNVTSTRNTNSLGGAVGSAYVYDSTLNINNMNSNGTVSTNTSSYYIGGLFGTISLSGAASATLNGSSSTGSVSGGTYVGGLIGYNYGNAASAISNSYSEGNITGTGTVGGLVGSNYYAGISNSHAVGTIHANDSGGGLVGYNVDAPVSNSYATGDVIATSTGGNIGGLIGYNYGPLSAVNNSYASGLVDGTPTSMTGGSNVGGLIGYNYAGAISNSHASGDVSGASSIGGLVGYNTTAPVSNSYASGNVNGLWYYLGGLVGYQDTGAVSNSHATGNVTGDMNTSIAGGLLGYATNTPISQSYATGAVTAASTVGGLLGSFYGYTGGTLVVDSSYATGHVTSLAGAGSSSYAGGLIGYLYNYNNTISKVTNSFAKGNVNTNGYYVGGLLGYVYDDSGKFYLTNTYSNGAVTGYDPAYTGGLIGYAFDNTGISFITNNYWDKNLSGQTIGLGTASTLNRSVTNLTGLTTAQSKQLSSYTGWDISSAATGSSSIWYINNGVATPVLRSLMGP